MARRPCAKGKPTRKAMSQFQRLIGITLVLVAVFVPKAFFRVQSILPPFTSPMVGVRHALLGMPWASRDRFSRVAPTCGAVSDIASSARTRSRHHVNRELA